MYFAQFFRRGVITGDLIEAVGDRSVIILDGRESLGAHHDIAADECSKRGFAAYQIRKGESFTNYTPITDMVYLYIGEIQ